MSLFRRREYSQRKTSRQQSPASELAAKSPVADASVKAAAPLQREAKPRVHSQATRRIFLKGAALGTLSIFLFGATGCNLFRQRGRTGNAVEDGARVVVYCSVDDIYAKPIFNELERTTGLRIDVVYDAEAAKTAGLANRIRAEKSRPGGDIFWSSALLQTLLLTQEGLTEQYISPGARYIPPEYKSDEAKWNALGVRSRVLVYHRGTPNPPRRLMDLTQPRFKGKIGISNPLFGSASDEAAALAVRWGIPKTLDYFRSLKKNGARVLPGNAVVAERVASGELLAGVTDSDDYFAQLKQGRNDIVAAPDSPDMVRIILNVSLLQGAPHRKAALKLIDAMLRPEIEAQVAQTMRGVESTRDEPDTGTAKEINAAAQRDQSSGADYRFSLGNSPDDTAQWPAAWQKIKAPLADILLK